MRSVVVADGETDDEADDGEHDQQHDHADALLLASRRLYTKNNEHC